MAPVVLQHQTAMQASGRVVNCENGGQTMQKLHWPVEVLYWAVGKDCCGRSTGGRGSGRIGIIYEALSLPKHRLLNKLDD